MKKAIQWNVNKIIWHFCQTFRKSVLEDDELIVINEPNWHICLKGELRFEVGLWIKLNFDVFLIDLAYGYHVFIF